MTFDPARPRYTLPFAGDEYELLGTLDLVEAVENALKKGIVQITWGVVGMGVTDTSKLLAAVLTATGKKLSPKDAGDIIFNKLGVNSQEFQTLQLHLYAFLRIVIEPPELRERVATDMGEMMGKLNARPASPGESTKNSV